MTEGQENKAQKKDIPNVHADADAPLPAGAEEEPQGDRNPAPETIDFETLAKESHDRYLRSLADFENYKKRTQKEQADLVKFSNERILLEMLPVIDNFNRALSSSKETRDFEKIVEGVEMIQKQFLSALEKFGVRPIDSLNQPFDPFLHQAVGQSPVEEDSGVAENQVVAETQTGYFLNDRVLRPSLVIVAKKMAPPLGEPLKDKT